VKYPAPRPFCHLIDKPDTALFPGEQKNAQGCLLPRQVLNRPERALQGLLVRRELKKDRAPLAVRRGLDKLADAVNCNVITIEPTKLRYLNYCKGFRNVIWKKEE
jgi:hypothetical protein